jgi:NAD(P)-dependent dehydrogenase (short-subunit alcohol dehydrogenase family)
MREPIQVSLEGRVVLVTGATAGIGLEIAADLVALGAEVILGCRTREKGEAAQHELTRRSPDASTRLLIADLSIQASVRAGIDMISRTTPVLHVLVNNAGLWSERRQVTAEGIELTFATNVLGYALVTALLGPQLEAAHGARVVNVASAYAHGLDLTDVEFARRPYSGAAAYAQSKQANRMWSWALARRLESRAVTVNALHPGAVATQLLRSAFPGVGGRTPQAGADTASWLAAAPEVAGVTGKFFADRAERRCEFRDPAQEELLFALCEKMTHR